MSTTRPVATNAPDAETEFALNVINRAGEEIIMSCPTLAHLQVCCVQSNLDTAGGVVFQLHLANVSGPHGGH